ncbi:hypothetical protein RND81_03G061300 [Saponaria officinalis]|uniref:Uncharacterized protein n=1 Tax=Saponaria officinalis TaxID=3572 RepID=A0AAW1M857_SAPOF
MGYYLLSYSIIVNIILSGTLICSKWTNKSASDLSWTKKAAEEAEEVASIPCSGHGLAFLDGVSDDGSPVCECYACFTGYHCSAISRPCLADADSGNPLFLEPFWKKHKENSSVLVSAWHRLGYSYPVEGKMSGELQKYIFKLHELVGNAVTEGRHIVFGTGSTQLLNAAVHSLSSFSPVSPALVLVSIPYYPLYKSQTEYFETTNYKFKGDVSKWKNKTDGAQMLIEFVTSPNNPDCQLKKKVLQEGPLTRAIHDHVYYWPHYTAIPAPCDEDIMIFSISKLTGHAGSRFGWALVKDESVYQKMKQYVSYNTMGVSHDTQLRMLELLKVVVDEGGKKLFEFGYETMKDRWKRLNAIFSTTSRFSLQNIPPQYCTYYQRVRQPSPGKLPHLLVELTTCQHVRFKLDQIQYW